MARTSGRPKPFLDFGDFITVPPPQKEKKLKSLSLVASFDTKNDPYSMHLTAEWLNAQYYKLHFISLHLYKQFSHLQE
jgi:hypothetical protein